MMTIGHTARILLRELHPDDAEAFYMLNSDLEVIKYTGDPPFHSVEEAKQFLINYDHFKKYARGRWAICDRSTKEILGWCGLKYHEKDGENDLGFRLFQKHWNKGYATESSHLALQYGFRRLGLDTIITRAMKQNFASLRVIQKLGMKFELEFEENENICEQHRLDKYSYALLGTIPSEVVLY